MALPRREASLRPARALHSRDHFVPVQASSTIYVSPSPVSSEASRDLWRSIGPSTMVVFERRCERIHCVHNIKGDSLFMFTAKRSLYFR